MNSNTTLAVTQETSVRDIVSPRTGKVTGTQYIFACDSTPRELKERLKTQGLKGNKLSNAIRDIRKGALSLAKAETQVFLEGMYNMGFIATTGQHSVNTGVLRFEKIREEKDSKATVNKTLKTAAENLMKNIGCSMEEALAYLA